MTDYLDRRIDVYNDPNFAAAFDELSFWSSRFGALLYRNLELVKGIRVLDLACGTGFPLVELAQIHGSSCVFVGLDPWKPALARAALKLRTYDWLNYVYLIRGDGAHMPLPNRYFDLITCNLGLNNFENVQAVLAECTRVAKPQGRIVLTTNIKGHMQEFYDVYREVLKDRADYLDRLVANENHRGTVESARALVEGAGFRVSKVVEDRFHMRFVDGSALFRHSLVRIGFLDGWRAVVDPGDEKTIFASLEEKLNKLAHKHGELKLTIPMLYVEGRRK
jgi:arsenite methyltransferase